MTPNELHRKPCHTALIEIRNVNLTVDNGLSYWGYYRCTSSACPNYLRETFFANEIVRPHE